MNLNATVSGSEHDPFYEMALLYCFDELKNYCFSLTRMPNSQDIEVMVLDQVNQNLDTLTIDLYRNRIEAIIPRESAKKLDGHEKYTVNFLVDDTEFKNIKAALEKIFDGKMGLTVHAF